MSDFDLLFSEFAHEIFAVGDFLVELLPVGGEEEDVIFDGDGAGN